MTQEHTYPNTKWIQLISPTQEELSEIVSAYNIDSEIAQDLASPTPRQSIEAHSNSIYAIFHIPAYKHSHSKGHIQEIDIIIGKDFVITVQFDTIDTLDRLSKEVQVETLLKGELKNSITPGILFLEIMRSLYESINDEIEHLQDTLRTIEDKIFNGQEKEMVFALSKAGRDLLDLKRTIVPHETNLKSLSLIASKAQDIDLFERTRHILEEEYKKVKSFLLHNIDLAVELRETNNSLLFTKQNEVMNTLTILAFVTFPLSLIAGIFGMNTKVLPIVGIDNDFWIITGFMLVATIAMVILFKIKKWL